jgi:uncharacterized protein (TIGR03435 family)
MRALLLASVLAMPLVAAAQDAATPRFEAATLKINTSGDTRNFLLSPPGRFTATNVPLQLLIMFAYELQSLNQPLVGAPAWVATDRYDIVATTGGQKTPHETMAMLRTLLEERFKLVVRRDTRSEDVYHLVVARSDGRLGRDITPSTTNCEAVIAAALAATIKTATESGKPSAMPLPGAPCFPQMPNAASGMTMKLEGLTMAALANRIRNFAGRPVLDRTGLTGTFDATLRFTPDPAAMRASALQGVPAPAPVPPANPQAAIDEAPPLQAALQEQLGLKLEPQTGTTTVLVIERIEKPTDD